MKARLVNDPNGNIKLLYKNGSFSNDSIPLLADLILNFKNIEHFGGTDGKWSDDYADMAFYPGDTIAIVTDKFELIIYSGEAFSGCLESSLDITDYVTSDEYAQMHDKSREIIKVYCRQGKIPAKKVGRAWMIPKNAPYPVPEKRQRPKSCGPRSSDDNRE